MTVVLDDQMMKETPDDMAPWLIYALSMGASRSKALEAGVPPDFFGEQLAARGEVALSWGTGQKPGRKNVYLDQLAAVVKAGFLAEYLVVYLSAPGWVLSGEQVQALRLDAFRAYAAVHLQNHVVETHSQATIADHPAPEPPGTGVLLGIPLKSVSDCAVLGPALEAAVASWEIRERALPQVSLAPHNREQLASLLESALIREKAHTRGVVWISPDVAKLYADAGFCAIENHLNDAAEILLNRRLVLNPTDGRAGAELAHLFVVRKRYPEALAQIDESMAIVDAQCMKAVLWRKRGYVYIEMNRIGDARASYLKSLELDPGNATALRELEYIAKMQREKAADSATGKAGKDSAAPADVPPAAMIQLTTPCRGD